MDTLEYWKGEAERLQKELKCTQDELTEFTEQSRDLEHELETQLDQAESKNAQLTTALTQATAERDALRSKHSSTHDDSRKTIQRLEESLTQVTRERDEYAKYVRELEQSNDDLERAKRNVVAMLEDYQNKFEETVEKNVLLETELTEKDTLTAALHHLKEETRDLKEELAMRDRHKPHATQSDVTVTQSAPRPAATVAPMRQQVPVESMDTSPSTSTTSALPRSATHDGTTASVSRLPRHRPSITPASRVSALNIVGDLLRKVGALEMKLSTSQRAHPSAGGARDGGPHAKQPHLDNPPPASSSSSSSATTPQRPRREPK